VSIVVELVSTSAVLPVDVYLANVDLLEFADLSVISSSELTRANRLSRHADRQRFLLGTVLMRVVAAEALGCAPRSVVLDRQCERCGRHHGRPRIAGSCLQLSLSHAGKLAAVACTMEARVGIDIEVVRGLGYRELVGRVCNETEAEFVTSAGDFGAYWTRKEAVQKAVGTHGVVPDMNQIHVSPPSELPSLLVVGSEALPCSMATVCPGPDYAGAVAVMTGAEVEYRIWSVTRLLAEAGEAGTARSPSRRA
jgi:4'-phosphopantetheinyl transferase